MNKILVILFIFFLPLHLTGQEPINEFEELARGYYNQGKLKQAAEFYSKSGYAYWNKGENNKAISSFQKSYDLFTSQNNINAAIAVGNNLGLLFLDTENYKNAYNAFSNVLKYTRKNKNNNEIFNALINVGAVCIELTQYNESISIVTEALNLAKELNNLKFIAKCYSLLAESYEKMGNSSSAYKYFELYSSIDEKIKTEEMENMKLLSDEEISKAHEKKRITEIELKIKKGELKLTQDSLTVSERIAFERQMQVEIRNEQLKKKEIQLRYEIQIRHYLIIGIILTALFLLILGYLLRQKLKDNKTLSLQKEEITKHRNILDLQNKKITDSIYYGLRIQQAMLPNIESLKKNFETFIVYKPKDIVSGDFYWFFEMELGKSIYSFIAVVDCTGHGVPGAFMSMIGHRLISEIIIERNIIEPSLILEKINASLRKELDQDNNKSQDGMDISLCRICKENGHFTELVFAGAKRPILIYKQSEKNISVIEGDRISIGGILSNTQKSFTDKKIKIQSGDMLILFSDGIIDQPNPLRNRFGSDRFISLIKTNAHEPMIKIKDFIEKAFDEYKLSEEQRDDITIIGLRLN
jgi:serine phosphatase RsbU (regulator of sigma subunit)